MDTKSWDDKMSKLIRLLQIIFSSSYKKVISFLEESIFIPLNENGSLANVSKQRLESVLFFLTFSSAAQATAGIVSCDGNPISYVLSLIGKSRWLYVGDAHYIQCLPAMQNFHTMPEESVSHN